MQPDGPVAAGRNLVALEVEELVGRHIVRQLIGALGHEHSGENEAVEHDVVLANEVDDAGVLVLPVLFPVIGQQFLGVADVADGGIKPHIEHFTLDPLDGHGDAPVEVARHGAGLQMLVEPRLALTIDIGLPLFVVFKNPLAQGGFPLVEGHVPMLGVLHYGHIAGDGALGINQVGGV